MSSHIMVGKGAKDWTACKTRINGLHFRILKKPKVVLAIDLLFQDEGKRKLVYDKFCELKGLLGFE